MTLLSLLAQAPSYYYETRTYESSSSASPAEVFGIVLAVFFFVAIVYVIMSYLYSRIFRKAGIPNWIAWVPFYNQWKMLQLGGFPGWWILLGFIPLVNYVAIVISIIALYNIGLKLGKSGVFVLWAIFFPYVWFIWLGFDSSTWNDSLGRRSIAPEHLTSPSSTAPGATPPTPPVATL